MVGVVYRVGCCHPRRRRLKPLTARLKVEGATALRRGLRGLPVEFRKRLAKIYKAAALAGVPTAKKEAPNRSGKLAGSVRALGSQREGRIAAGKAKVPYAGPIHFGWEARGIKPNQFLFRAAGQKEDVIVGVFADETDDLIDDVFRREGVRLR